MLSQAALPHQSYDTQSPQKIAFSQAHFPWITSLPCVTLFIINNISQHYYQPQIPYSFDAAAVVLPDYHGSMDRFKQVIILGYLNDVKMQIDKVSEPRTMLLMGLG